jgi:hypothetical protein
LVIKPNNFIEEIMPNSILFVSSYSLPCSRFNYPFDKHCYTECPEDLVDKDIKSISAKIMGIIWPDGKRAHLLD